MTIPQIWRQFTGGTLRITVYLRDLRRFWESLVLMRIWGVVFTLFFLRKEWVGEGGEARYGRGGDGLVGGEERVVVEVEEELGYYSAPLH